MITPRRSCYLLLGSAQTALLIVFTTRAANLVEDCKPRTEIVITVDAVRAIELAAKDHQHYHKHISYTRLPLIDEPPHTSPLHVDIGRSRYDDQFDISVDILAHCGFHYRAGDRCLVGYHHADDLPLDGISHSMPRSSSSWYYKLTRIHARHCGNPPAALSPTGRLSLHLPDAFGKPHLHPRHPPYTS